METKKHRTRGIQIKFWATPEERDLIEKKMELFGTTNRGAYLRKIAIDGYVVKLELPELRDLVSLMRRISSSENQIAKRLHTTGNLYDADLQDIKNNQEKIWEGIRKILLSLAAIK